MVQWQPMDEHENEGWISLCAKCEAHYSVEGPTDTCPVCGWRDSDNIRSAIGESVP